MFSMTESPEGLTFLFTSDLHAVDRVAAAIKSFVEKEDPGLNDAPLQAVARELLLNAIEHGNGKNPEKKVTCSLHRIGSGRFSLYACDEGPGFDHRKRAFSAPEDSKETRRRGYGIIQGYADEIEFNDEGNEITAYLTLPRPTGFELEKQGETWLLKADSDITAGSAERFRTALLSWADQGSKNLLIDLSNVENMDSIALSVLFSFSEILKAKGPDFCCKLTGVGPDLQNLFFMTRMNHFYKVQERVVPPGAGAV